MNYGKEIFGFLGAVVGFLFGKWEVAMGILIVLNVFDIVTGVWKAGKGGSITSTTMREGLHKKFGMWIYVIVGHFVDVLCIPVFGGMPIAKMTVIFSEVYNEGTSVIENVNALGVPAPKILIQSMERVKDLANEKNLKK
jgi:toxin secretion/phage lysis holin